MSRDAAVVPGVRWGGRGGFTLVQLLLGIVILFIVAALLRPYLHHRVVMSRAQAVLEDLRTVRSAALRFHERTGGWPEEVGRGVVPPELEEDLPQGFTFRKPRYTLDFDDWSRNPRAGFEAAVAYVSPDPEVGRAVMDELGPGVWNDGGSKYTWIIRE